eukprot:TRINITY_DN601_c0_g1_i3.p1 TRINITY_DN601_c0_g1~~TRINITY_DN601_c0_g1_i3.p1  ORF type:complete len:222 (-),score=38.37 TRINITY_DN601_c0_g1_i3:61-726(-)
MFSATMPASVERLARSGLIDEIKIQVGEPQLLKENEERIPLMPDTITQNVIFVHTYQKKAKLLEILRKTEAPPVLIFCDTIPTVDWVVGLLKSEQFHVAGIHSLKKQTYRFRVMQAFKEGRLDVLVATDVASRGIHVDNITHVINYDMPNMISSYIHRVGRTGRAGRTGMTTTLLTYHCKCAKDLKELLKKNKQSIPHELMDTKMFGHKVIQTELGDKVVM